MKTASESGHWYDRNGATAYEVPYADKSKGMRGTTLRDAKKLNLFPSVTTVMNIVAKPGLERWKQNNLLMSALTLPSIKDESLDDYAKRCVQDAAEQATAAAERGTYIHGSLEQFYLTGVIWSDHTEIIRGVESAILEEFGNMTWIAEKSFSSLDQGYGGKIDLHGENLVIDFKTKEFDADDKKLHWDEQAIQLAAYAYGLGMPDATLANVFVSVTNPGLVKIHIWKESTEHYFEGFRRMLELWKWTKGYDASQEVTK